MENKIVARLEQMAATQKEEFARLKRECREGFSTVHESITNMKTVMEGKRKILEDQLRKEISQIRKMVVLVWPGNLCLQMTTEITGCVQSRSLTEFACISYRQPKPDPFLLALMPYFEVVRQYDNKYTFLLHCNQRSLR